MFINSGVFHSFINFTKISTSPLKGLNPSQFNGIGKLISGNLTNSTMNVAARIYGVEPLRS